MTLLVLVLRALHVVGGVLWAGSAIFYFLFVEPSVKGAGPAGPKVMQNLLARRYPLFMNVVSGLTVVAGLWLFWIVSGGLNMGWITSGPGVGFALGSVVALVVYAIGFFMLRPRADRMGHLGAAIGQAGGQPTPDQAAEMHRLNEEMASIGRIDAILLTISLLAMATARYWVF